MKVTGCQVLAPEETRGTAIWSGRGKERGSEIILRIKEFHPAGHSATWTYPNISRNGRTEMIASRNGQAIEAKEAIMFEAKRINCCDQVRMKVVMASVRNLIQ
jgi:thymidine kinase